MSTAASFVLGMFLVESLIELLIPSLLVDGSGSTVESRFVVVTSTSEATCFVVTGAAGNAFELDGCCTIGDCFPGAFAVVDAGGLSSNALLALEPPHRLANNPASPPLPPSLWSPPPPFFFFTLGVLVEELVPVPDDRPVGVLVLLLCAVAATDSTAVSGMVEELSQERFESDGVW